MGTRGVWSLENVESKYPLDEWVDYKSVWVGENQSVGYIKMYGPSQWKFNFSTSTTTASSHLTASKYLQAGTSNPTHAWFVGGQPGPISDSKKITYASDTAADNPSSRLPSPRSSVGAISGKTISYLLGGIPYTQSTISKLTHASDTMVDLPGSHMAASKYMTSSGHDGGVQGYFFSGMPGYTYSETQRITFANDTRTTLPSSSRMVYISENSNPGYNNSIPYWGTGNLQCPTHCYYAGGNPGGAEFTSTFQKLTFASETWAVSPSKMARSMRYLSGITVSSSKGCIAGGAMGPHGTAQSKVDLVTYATDSWATEPSMQLGSIPGAGQYTTYGGSAATGLNDSLNSGTPGIPTIDSRWFDDAAASPNYGVFCGTPGGGSNLDKIDFSTETMEGGISTIPDAPSGINKGMGGSSLTNGYFLGGRPSTYSGSYIRKHTYSTDATVTIPARLATPSAYEGVPMDSPSATYITNVMGASPSGRSVWNVVHSNDTSALIPGLIRTWNTEDVKDGMSTSNLVAGTGYHTGGVTPGWSARSHTEKITFASSTRARLPGSNYPDTSLAGISVGAPSSGYYGGGYSFSHNYVSWLYKMTYSTGTFSNIGNTLGTGNPSKGDQNERKGGTGNTTQGYFYGGMLGSNYWGSNVDKFIFSTDTISSVPGMMPTAGPGSNPYQRMIDYLSASVRTNNRPNIADAPIATPTPSTSAVPVNFGLRVMMNGSNTNIGKLDFTTDTTSKLTDQPGPFTAADAGGGWNDNSGGKMVYGTAGAGPDVFGLPYSTGTVTKISDSPISPALNAAVYKAWTYSTTHGFFSGGRSWSPSYPSHHTNTSRYTFSTDTIQTSYPSQRLVHAVERARGVANSTHAYVTGGRTANPGANDKSYVQKASFSTGDFAQVPSANLNAVTTGHNLTGNTTSARIAGKETYSGQSDESRFQKLTYSNDTMTTLPGSTLPGTPSTRHGRGVAATGNQTQGYFGGSTDISPATNVKIVYATDTTSETPAWANEASVRDTVAKSAGEQNGSGNAPSPNLI